MPNCFQLIRKTEPDKSVVKLQQIDEEICAHMEVPVDPDEWVGNWYNTIGFCLAMGKDFAWIRERAVDEQELKIINFLDANFIPDAWTEIGRQ